jgi:hypothetical protein
MSIDRFDAGRQEHASRCGLLAVGGGAAAGPNGIPTFVWRSLPRVSFAVRAMSVAHLGASGTVRWIVLWSSR